MLDKDIVGRTEATGESWLYLGVPRPADTGKVDLFRQVRW